MRGRKHSGCCNWQRVIQYFLLCSLLAISSCNGGGTRGTGVDPAARMISFGGVVNTADGKPAAMMTIACKTAASESSQLSDASGAYQFELLLSDGEDITCHFTSVQVDWEFVLTAIPEHANGITIVWGISGDFQVSPDSVTYLF